MSEMRVHTSLLLGCLTDTDISRLPFTSFLSRRFFLSSQMKTPLIVAAEHEARGTADALLMADADTDVRYGENELSSLDSAASASLLLTGVFK